MPGPGPVERVRETGPSACAPPPAPDGIGPPGPAPQGNPEAVVWHTPPPPAPCAVALFPVGVVFASGATAVPGLST